MYSVRTVGTLGKREGSTRDSGAEFLWRVEPVHFVNDVFLEPLAFLIIRWCEADLRVCVAVFEGAWVLVVAGLLHPVVGPHVFGVDVGLVRRLRVVERPKNSFTAVGADLGYRR